MLPKGGKMKWGRRFHSCPRLRPENPPIHPFNCCDNFKTMVKTTKEQLIRFDIEAHQWYYEKTSLWDSFFEIYMLEMLRGDPRYWGIRDDVKNLPIIRSTPSPISEPHEYAFTVSQAATAFEVAWETYCRAEEEMETADIMAQYQANLINTRDYHNLLCGRRLLRVLESKARTPYLFLNATATEADISRFDGILNFHLNGYLPNRPDRVKRLPDGTATVLPIQPSQLYPRTAGQKSYRPVLFYQAVTTDNESDYDTSDTSMSEGSDTDEELEV